MTDDDDSIPQLLTERIERRLSEESGRTRTEMATGFGQIRIEMEKGRGEIRAEMEKALGEIRTEMEKGRGEIRTEMAAGLGQIRAEMADRNAALLKWALIFFTTQMTGTAGLLALFR